MNWLTKILKANEDKYFVIHSKVVGCTFKNDNGTDRQKILSRTKTGEHLKLSSYTYDKDKQAIGVYNFKMEQLGNISADFLDDLTNFKNDNRIVSLTAEVTGGNGKYYGCNLTFKIKK